MIIELVDHLNAEQKTRLLETLRNSGCECRQLESTGAERIGILAHPGHQPDFFCQFDGVRRVETVEAPYKLASRQMHPEDTRIRVGDVSIGGERLSIIAGPCAVESREQAMTIARAVRKAGAVLFRGGAYKPRTSPYSFQGLQEEGLKILAEVRETYGLGVVTEITSPSQADLMMKYVDVVQVGARNMQNFELLKCVGRMGKPVLLKRGLAGTIQEWLMSAEYILSEGNEQVILCERGIRTFEPYTRNTLDLSAIPVLKQLTHLPIIIDPSHATGIREKVSPMARAAVSAGADGLMIEVHHDPDNAMSDGPQSLYPEQFKQLMRDLYVIAPVIGKQLDFSYLDKAKAVQRPRIDGTEGKRRAAFMGRIGTFSHKACLQYFGEEIMPVPLPTFKAIFDAVKDGDVDYGVIPLENSLSGSIHENYDHLLQYDLNIIGEIKLRIMHHLLAKPGTRIEEIHRVLSHPQVFGQCRQYLDQNDWEQVAVGDTAAAAARVRDSEDAGDAAIANLVAADTYGLEVLDECIETNPRNYTRFVIIGAAGVENRPPEKTSLICSTRNEPGALYDTLRVFAENHINMIKLESRPVPGEPWKYLFYIDVEADILNPELAPALEALRERTAFLKVLGSY